MPKRPEPTYKIKIPRDHAELVADALTEAGIADRPESDPSAAAGRNFVQRLRAFAAGEPDPFGREHFRDPWVVWLTRDAWKVAAALLGVPDLKLSKNLHPMKDDETPYHLHDVYDDGVTIGYVESNGVRASGRRVWYAGLRLPDYLVLDPPPPAGYVAAAVRTRAEALAALSDAYAPLKRLTEGSGR